MAHDVFISHSVKDKATADAVCAMLESNGIRCWIAPRDVVPSMEWGEAIVDAIEQAKIMVLVFTANANTSAQIRREVERAVNHGVAILPLRIEDVLPAKGLDYFIGNLHWLDALTPPLEAHLKNLSSTIKILLAHTVPGTPPVPVQAEKPLFPGGRRAEEGTPVKGGGREGGPAPRHFWSARAWAWAPWTITVLLLCSMAAWMIGSHFAARPPQPGAPNPISAPPPASAPAGPASIPETVPAKKTSPVRPGGNTPAPATSPQVAGNAASLRDTMKTLQNELSSIGTVSYTGFGQNKTNSSTYQYDEVGQVSNVVADPAQCRVSYHWKQTLLRGYDNLVEQDKDGWFPLSAATSVVVEPESQYKTETSAPGFVTTSTTPPVAELLVREADGRLLGTFLFPDATLAHRTASTLKPAVKLCGGTLTN